MVKVALTPTAAAQLEALNNPLHARVLRLLIRLEQWPEVSGVKRSQASWPGGIDCGQAITAFSFMLTATT